MLECVCTTMPSVTGVAHAGSGFHFHQAHAAVGGDGEFFVVTEMGDIRSQLVRGLHYGCALLYFNLFAIYVDL